MKTVSVNSSTGMIEIKFDYNVDDIAIVKDIPDRAWNKSKKLWIVPASEFHADYIIRLLEPAGFQINPRVYGMLRSKNKREHIIKRDGLYDFQSKAIDFIDGTLPSGRALIADEQGLGKTIEALYWISVHPEITKTLIVCPASVLYKWKAEIEKWDKGKSVSIIAKTSDAVPESNYILMSYAIMARKASELSEIKWDCFISDECHKLKSGKSQRTRAAKLIESTYFLALSGTPILNRPEEFFNILHMINPKVWNSWWTFVHRYCGAKSTYFGLDTSGASNLEELADKLKTTMIRRLKKDVLTELPEITRTKIPVKVDASEINIAYRNMFECLRQQGKGQESSGDALRHLSLLRRAIGTAKVPFVIELAESVLNENENKKIVIYAVHKTVVEELGESLQKYGITCITGNVDTEERWIRQTAFQNNDSPRVMIISSAGGEGINLYRADTIIFAEREWGPSGEEQAEARLHRIGQKNAVEAMYVIASDTLDDDIDSLIDGKRNLIGQIVQGAPVALTIEKELMDKIMYGG